MQTFGGGKNLQSVRASLKACFAPMFLIGLSAGLVSACAQKPVTEEPKVDAKWVEQVSRDHNHEVLLCYQDALKFDKKIQGDFVLELDASAVGKVQATRVSHSLAPTFDKCVTSKAASRIYPWMKTESSSIQERYRLYLNSEGQPMAEYTGPGMDPEMVRQAVKQHIAEVRECYIARVRRMPNLAGKLILRWDILGSGEVTNVTVAQSFDPVIDPCVSTRVAKWKFPSPPNNMVANVSFPFEFTPATAK